MAVRATQAYVSVLRPTSGAFELSCSNSFAFASTADLVTLFVNAVDNFGFISGAEHNYVVVVCSNSFGLKSECGMDAEVFITQYLGWTPRQFADCQNSLWAINPDKPNSGSRAFQVDTYDVSNTFGLTNGVVQAHNVSNSFSLDPTAAVAIVVDAWDHLSLDDSATTEDTDYGRDTTQHFLRQSVTYRISNSKCIETEYAPQVGAGDNLGFDEMETTPPVLTHNTLAMSWPFDVASLTIELKNPQFGDSHSLVFSVVDGLTRGGDRVVIADPNWPNYESKQFTVANIKRSQMLALVEFMNATLGKEIRILDWEGTEWKAIIDTPQTGIQETKAGFTVTLNFQGIKV